MPKNKKLFSLYVVGEELTITDGDQSETVWIQKLNQNEHENAYRRANQKRATFLALRKSLNDEEILALKGEYEATFSDRDSMIDYLVNDKIARVMEAREAELAATDEWAKENYYQGLLDAWHDGLFESHALGEVEGNVDYEEAKTVYAEMERFADQLNEKLDAESKRERRDYESWDLQKLDDEVTRKLIEAEADSRWLNEYKMCEIYHAVREADNHRTNYFDSRSEVDEIPLETLLQLLKAYAEISLGLTEGKD